MSGRHAAFLRAINTGKRRTTNVAMCEALESVGATQVGGVLASGNLVYTGDGIGEDRLSEALGARLGFDVPVMVRTADEVRSMIDDNPYDIEPKHVFVGILKNEPDPSLAGQLEAMTDEPTALHGRQLFWAPPEGEFLSDLSIPRVEGIAGPMTMRTLATIHKVAARLG